MIIQISDNKRQMQALRGCHITIFIECNEDKAISIAKSLSALGNNIYWQIDNNGEPIADSYVC